MKGSQDAMKRAVTVVILFACTLTGLLTSFRVVTPIIQLGIVTTEPNQDGVETTNPASPSSSDGTEYDSALREAMDQVVRLLLPSDEVDSYLQRQKQPFYFFVYELPVNASWRHFSDCIQNRYNTPDWYKKVDYPPDFPESHTSNCDWGASVCTQYQTSSSTYSSRRFNRNGDVVLSKLFSEYRGGARTYSADKADLFIVPYPSTAHCACLNEKPRCFAVSDDDIQHQVLDHLPYFNDQTRSRHLFLSSVQRNFNHPSMVQMPLLATLEIAGNNKCPLGHNCGHLIQPYVNTNAEFQPGRWLKGPLHHKIGLEHRPIAIAAVMSGSIGEKGFRLRQDFIKSLKDMQLSNKTIAGRPVQFGGFRKRSMNNETVIFEIYQKSIFCPCLRGNTPAQKRFFDVILNGCIPVVIEYPESKEVGFPSYFKHKETSVRLTYPWARGIFYDEPHMGLDYGQIVVAVNGTCGLRCLIPTVEDLLLNHPARVVAMQQRISKLASLFTFGMQEDAFQYPDAVSALLVQARHFISKLQES